MLLTEKIGRLDLMEINQRKVDYIFLEWHETRKRILRKQTAGGKEVSLKFLNENPELTEGDVLYEDESAIIAVSVLPCSCIVIKPTNMFEMASVCYEIGNKHLPLFYENESLLVPFDLPMMKLLQAQGYDVKQEERKLMQPLKTTVAPHGDGNNSLFTKIMKLTNPAP
jgi:urease accessory protein